MIVGKRPDGSVAFRSRELRGVVEYARKCAIASVRLSADGGFRALFRDHVVCEGTSGDARALLGLFVNARWVDEIDCEHALFDQGSTPTDGVSVVVAPDTPTFTEHGHMRLGPWELRASVDSETKEQWVNFSRWMV